MTQDEFDKTRFGLYTWVMYEGQKRYVIAVNFPERLLGLCDEKEDVEPDEWIWVRCENVQIVNHGK